MQFLKESLIEVLLLSVAFLIVTISISFTLVDCEGNWFARSGSIMVMCAVMTDFRIGKLQQDKNSSASVVSGLGIPMPSDLPKSKQLLLYIANMFAILGTLIWGYGDLVLNHFLT